MAILIPHVKQVWADGDASKPLSAARMGVLEEGILDVSLAPAVRVFHNASQSITTATATALAFNSERYDQAGGAASTQHDTVTNNSRLTALYAGVYAISATIEWATNATGERYVGIRYQGTTDIARQRVQASAAIPITLNVSAHYALAVNEYVEVMVFQTSGGALNVTVGGNYSPEFSMVRVA